MQVSLFVFVLYVNLKKYKVKNKEEKGGVLMLTTILIIILVLMLVGALPTWPHSASWGYAPSGVLVTVLIIILILMLLGRI